METVNQLQQQYVDFLSSLYSEGLLEKQFQNIQILAEDEPQFVSKLLALYFEDSERRLHNLATALDQTDVDYDKVRDFAVPLYDCNINLGTQRVNNVCVTFRSCYKSKNLEGCLRCMQQLKDEYYLVKSKLQTLLMLEQRIVAAGGSTPIVE
ncbi:Histidine-containing phosphotransfer protein [Heracleum sosnowskyi]|uniref:Histidine-containing phosphotransfer protein n=1 Tax=Heracleum sosnowskyi TaxID=360622 RepID=A0AAD8MKE5_9APIA|nr:Histidine-containing phosphotransfer protein [Heracleum sosnowskyi]KAK1376606.1 Histidine-containing phosphotransfer protein [Heracleum sosnowskyi]